MDRFLSGLTTGRLCGKAVILLLGLTGHGKSCTINKLVGSKLLGIGRHQSTTKVVQRVYVPAMYDDIQMELAFDDTPGLEDTTVADRVPNAVLFHRYCQLFSPSLRANEIREMSLFLSSHDAPKTVSSPSFRSQAYPNAILVTVALDTIKHDAQNDIKDFHSPLGKTIRALNSSGLYDRHRPNVVILVTKALGAWNEDTRDATTTKDADERWKADVVEKERIIYAICEKVFGPHPHFPIVFVENGERNTEKGVFVLD